MAKGLAVCQQDCAGRTPIMGRPNRGLGQASVRFFPSHFQPCTLPEKHRVASEARVCTWFFKPWAWASHEGPVGSYYWAHLEAPPSLCLA